jgi:hypothetical protein
MITTGTTALMLTMSLLAAGPSVAVKVFADTTVIQASDQNTEQSNAAQIDQQSDGDGVQLGSISQENNAVNDHKQDLVWCVFNPVTLEEICPPPR